MTTLAVIGDATSVCGLTASVAGHPGHEAQLALVALVSAIIGATVSMLAVMTAALTGWSELRMWHDQIQYKPATTGGVNMWHQDSPYWPHVTTADQVTAWIALDDVDEENGCMHMVPGSHAWGDASVDLAGFQDFADLPAIYRGNTVTTAPCPVPAGGMHVHHAWTWHGSNANISGRPRRAIAIHMMGPATCYQEHPAAHPCKPLITVAPGEKITGDAFPQLWPQS